MNSRSTGVFVPTLLTKYMRSSISCYNDAGVGMTQKAVEATFASLFALTDLRQLFRETKPSYQFNGDQTRQIRAILTQVRESLDVIEKELLK